MTPRGLLAVAFPLVLVAGCEPIVGTPIEIGPINACDIDQFPCEGYVLGGANSRAQCTIDTATQKRRCEVGRPAYAYTVVVHVPDSSYYAPGRTFAITNEDLTPQPGVPIDPKCPLPDCVALPDFVTAEGKYRVTAAASVAVRAPLPNLTSIPVRVEFEPLAARTTTEASSLGLPLEAVRTLSRYIKKKASAPFEISYLDAVSVGNYLRIVYPQPPFDAYFPPVFSKLSVTESFFDDVILGEGDTLLDDETGATRTTSITRKDGLDGWRVWLADEPSLGGRRVSSVKTLSGTTATATLHTVGVRQATSSALRQNINVVIAPPEGFLAVPRLQSLIPNGGPFGFAVLEVPPLPSPVSISGVVTPAESTVGIASRVLLTSVALERRDGTLDSTLKYESSLATDARGHFATVVPPGTFDVTLEPLEGTGFSKTKSTFDTRRSLQKAFHPARQTLAFGRALLADGRPLAFARVEARPAATSLSRPVQTMTDRDGRFRWIGDQGAYDVAVEPQPGTDFPRALQTRTLRGETTDLGDIVIVPPARLAFQITDPRNTEIKIGRAVVRVFAAAGQGASLVEVAHGMTDAQGRVELLMPPFDR
jgi:hypothetical protein